MITFSDKSTREHYLYESEGVRINGEVNYNGNGFTATVRMTTPLTNSITRTASLTL